MGNFIYKIYIVKKNDIFQILSLTTSIVVSAFSLLFFDCWQQYKIIPVTTINNVTMFTILPIVDLSIAIAF